MAEWIKIEACRRGYLVTTPNMFKSEQVWPLADDMYAVPTAQAALHCVATILGIEPASLYAPALAIADGFPATGGGLATHHVEPAPELPPAVEALLESQQEDPPLNGPDSPGEAAP